MKTTALFASIVVLFWLTLLGECQYLRRQNAACRDQINCGWYVRYNLCRSRNAAYRAVSRLCRKSCGFCRPQKIVYRKGCNDLNRSCRSWVRYCTTNRSYMERYCRRTCQLCGCSDKNHGCSYWARIGECRRNPNYMRVNCRKSCGICATKPRPTRPKPRPKPRPTRPPVTTEEPTEEPTEAPTEAPTTLPKKTTIETIMPPIGTIMPPLPTEPKKTDAPPVPPTPKPEKTKAPPVPLTPTKPKKTDAPPVVPPIPPNPEKTDAPPVVPPKPEKTDAPPVVPPVSTKPEKTKAPPVPLTPTKPKKTDAPPVVPPIPPKPEKTDAPPVVPPKPEKTDAPPVVPPVSTKPEKTDAPPVVPPKPEKTDAPPVVPPASTKPEKTNAPPAVVNKKVTIVPLPINPDKTPIIPTIPPETSSLNSAKCGLPSVNQIVGGNVSKPGEWPWMVVLAKKTEPEKAICGASLITDRWILTAAHCFTRSNGKNPNDYVLRVGEFDLKKWGDETIVNMDKIIIHNKYDPKTKDYDIALIHVDARVKFSRTVKPICLASSAKNYPAGKKCTVAGWGYRHEWLVGGPEKLHAVEIPVVDFEVCKKTTARLGQGLSERMMCAGLIQGGKDSCQGDSGGPLMCRPDDGGKWEQVGIVSWGVGCARPNRYGVYTEVRKLHDWVKEITDPLSGLLP